MDYNTISKLPTIGTTIFTVMSQLAQQYNAVNLGQGFPDFSMSDELTEAVCNAMKQGYNQYTHMNGYPLLRERLAEKTFALYNASVDAETDITITPGGTYAIYTAITSVIHPGDEVIVFEPAYDSYIPNIVINGGAPVLISLQYPNYSIPWHEVRSKITSRTKMIILNSPHNPTGAVLRENDIEELQQIVRETNIYILSDEVYEHLIFNDLPHLSMLRYPALFERSFVCFSFGKTYHCTGWKLGYCIAPSALMKEFRKVHQFNCFSCNTPAQVGLANYLQQQESYLNLGQFMQKKKDYFQNLMRSTPFTPIPSYGSYFQCYSYQGLSDEHDTDFAMRLIKDYGIVTIPVSSFYRHGDDNKVLRFCFAKKEETLAGAVEKLTGFKA